MESYVNPNFISNYFGICYSKALNFVKYSGIKYVKIGRNYFVSEKALKEFLRDNTEINTMFMMGKSRI